MSGQPHPSQDALPPSVVERLDKVCDHFEAVWKAARAKDQRPRIEVYLSTMPESARLVLLYELIALEIAYRRRAGEEPRLEDYRQRFPFLNLAELAP